MLLLVKRGEHAVELTNVKALQELRFLSEPITEKHELFFDGGGTVCAIGPGSCGDKK